MCTCVQCKYWKHTYKMHYCLRTGEYVPARDTVFAESLTDTKAHWAECQHLFCIFINRKEIFKKFRPYVFSSMYLCAYRECGGFVLENTQLMYVADITRGSHVSEASGSWK